MNKSVHWAVPLDHPAYAGHFPGTPIVPGVMLLDIVMHTVAASEEALPDQCEISAVKFLSPARPGDELIIHWGSLRDGTIRFDIAAGARKVASGTMAVKNRAGSAESAEC